VGWLWYLGTLAPVIGLVQIGQQARADRYTYVPLVGLAIIVAWGMAEWAHRNPLRARVAWSAGLISLAALAIGSWQQVRHWEDSLALYRRAVAVTRPNALAHHGLGRALHRAGRQEEAAAHLTEAVSLAPGRAGPRIDMAQLLAERGQLEAAAQQYARAATLEPTDLRIRVNLARLLARTGRHAEARSHLEYVLAALSGGADLPVAFREALSETLAELPAER
ncbi:MAG TPA: tetratricopeptide repeat protein, partial [Myxococcota bacterium]